MSSDTGFFDPGMPGEEVRLRFPAYGGVYVVAWFVVGVVSVGGLFQVFSGKPVLALAGEFIGPVGVVGLFALALIVFYTRWRIIVTDRRVMMRPGFVTWNYREMRLDEIEAVSIGASRISVRGSGGRELSAKILPLTALWVADTIGVPYGMCKVIDGPPEDFLEEGEAVRHMEPSVRTVHLYRVAWFAVLLLFAAMFALVRINPSAQWATFSVAGLVVLLVVLPKPFRPAPWRLAVTDRRLMARWGMAMGPYLEEIRLDRIERIRYETACRELVFDGRGRRVAVPCGERRAGRILAAMGRTAEGMG